MRRLLFTLAVFLALALPTYAQNNASGALNASDSGACTTANACLILSISPNNGVTTIQLAGTFSATAIFEATVGPSWISIAGTPIGGGSSVTSATGTGIWTFPTAGIISIRVRLSVYASGNVSVNMQASNAFAVGVTASGSAIGGSCSTLNAIAQFSASTTLTCSSTVDNGTNVVFSEPITGTSNVLSVSNGTNGQMVKVYKTFTNASNFTDFYIDTTMTAIDIGTNYAGTGSARALSVSPEATTTGRWVFNGPSLTPANSLIPTNDNSENIGGSSNRVANEYVVGLHSGASAFTISTSGGDVTALSISTGQVSTFSGNVLPGIDSTYNLGGNGARWNGVNFSVWSSEGNTIAQSGGTGNLDLLVQNGMAVATSSTTGAFNVNGTGYWTGLTAEGSTKSTVCLDPVTMQLETNAAATCTVSAAKYKTNFEDSDGNPSHPINPADALDVVMQMKPLYFDMKDGSQKDQPGFIADWSPVEALIDRDTNGEIQSFKYENFTAYLAGAMQEQQRQIEDLKRQVAELKAKHE